MIGREKLFAIFDGVLASSDADDTEVFFHGQDFGLTRYANTYIHQNIDTNNANINIRTSYKTVSSEANLFYTPLFSFLTVKYRGRPRSVLRMVLVYMVIFANPGYRF